MRPPSYIRSVVDQNVVMRHMTVLDTDYVSGRHFFSLLAEEFSQSTGKIQIYKIMGTNS